MARTTSVSFADRVKRAGCWAVGLYAFALFFALGTLVSLLNLDILRALGGLILTALCTGLGIWLAGKGTGR